MRSSTPRALTRYNILNTRRAQFYQFFVHKVLYENTHSPLSTTTTTTTTTGNNNLKKYAFIMRSSTPRVLTRYNILNTRRAQSYQLFCT